jgi:acetylornithine deacetylase/succinyl-diaminopimelate desuccinylase-like protein
VSHTQLLDGVITEVRRAAAEQDDLRMLNHLVAIPSISTDGRHDQELRQGAAAVQRMMSTAGLDALTREVASGVPPFVCGSYDGAGADAQTVLLYAHYDVQPPGNGWETDPWQAISKGDGRIYGRGTTDDKGAIIAFLNSLRPWIATRRFPVNLRFLVEGGEEIGSPGLSDFIEENRSWFGEPAALALADTENLRAGLPCLTRSLRGNVTVLVRVEALRRPVHSGTAGGLLPDAALALNALLTRVADPLTVPGLNQFPAISPEERASLDQLPKPDEGTLRQEMALLDGVGFAADISQMSPYEVVWHRPAVTVIAQRAGDFDSPSNQVLPFAEAYVSVRMAPGQDTKAVVGGLVETLTSNPPGGVKVIAKLSEEPVDAWKGPSSGPAFEAATMALRAGYGIDPAFVGCGGSVGVVDVLSRRLRVPALLFGIEDPKSATHAPNESLQIADWRKLTESLAHFYPLLAAGVQVAAR